jgi:hypothetical protein
MSTLLVAAAVLLAQDPTTRPGGGLQTDPTIRPGANVATVLDGAWTVLAFERDGLPVPGATATTVAIRNGVATFTGGDAKTPPPRPMRLELGRFGRVRVDEVLAAPAPRPGDAPPGTVPPPAAPGTLDARPGVRVGNFALTRDYLVVSVIDARPGSGNQAPPGTGTAPGEPGSTANPKIPVNPAVVGTTGSPKPGVPVPKSDPGVRGDEFLAASALDRASIVLILKRSNGTGPGDEKK